MSIVRYQFGWSTISKCAAAPQVGFKHHKDYVGYVWAKQEEADYLRQETQVIWMWAEPSQGIIFFAISLILTSCVPGNLYRGRTAQRLGGLHPGLL